MREYHLYLIDPSTGHFKDRRDFSSEDDKSAIRAAAHCDANGPKELWRGVHKLKRWEKNF
jgi:hypothetical protein